MERGVGIPRKPSCSTTLFDVVAPRRGTTHRVAVSLIDSAGPTGKPSMKQSVGPLLPPLPSLLLLLLLLLLLIPVPCAAQVFRNGLMIMTDAPRSGTTRGTTSDTE